ncbi:MAG: SRPBCC family protein [Gammaproteobacteria bacterium]|nr:SRPBCC family protein [Gammaproteobacteria bacterium]
MEDRIEKSIEINAPVARVWRALTDHREFGEWFRVELTGAFIVGEVARGRITHAGLEHLEWEATVQAMEPERLFSFSWRPHATDPDADYSADPQTLVEFKLEPTPNGTHLVISESGFSALPDDSRVDAFRRNANGWEAQTKNIAAYVES